MAGESDALKMSVEIVNKAGPVLKDLQRSMRALAAETGNAHKLGIAQSKSHTLALSDLRKQVVDVGDRVKGTLAPALGVLGISSLSAAAGLAAVVAAVKSFSDSARHLQFLSRQTQLSVDQLRVLEALAPRIGSSVEEMDGALVKFNENMEKLRRTPLGVLRETFEALHVRPDPQVVSGWTDLISSLQGLPRAEQLGRIVQYLSQIRDISQKGVVLEAFGLPKAFANLSPKELQEQLDRIKQILAPMTPEAIAGGIAFGHAEPLWKRLFHLGENEGGIQPASFQMPGDWAGALKGGAAGADPRGAEGVIERGVLQALRDFAAEQKPGGEGGGGGGGGGAGGAMSAIRANYSPSGSGYSGAGNAAGEPSAGGGAGTGGGPASEPMGSLGGKPQGVEQLGGGLNRESFNKMFAGTPLAGHADDVIAAAKKNNISPALMAGVMAHETGKGTSPMLRERNNPAGLMHGSTGMRFGSIGEGIEAAGRSIGKNFRAGGGTIEGMAKSYAPVGAANDPGGLNRGWPAGVRRLSSQLEGGSAAPPHFNVADIRKSVMGSGPGAGGNTGTVPSDILAQARHVALESGPGGVQAFMRSQGHPMSGAWCGEFAASVIHSVGGTPPKNPAIASNWRNWGKPTDTPVPGDIAVARRGVRTGQTGSHVTIVEDFDPKSGTFHGLGGNQSRWESRFSAGGYDFRHGEAAKAAAEATRPTAEAHAMHGEELKKHFGVGRRGADKHPDLLGSARQSGLVGPAMTHKVEGSARLDVNFNGMPKGTTHNLKTEGLFKETRIVRGRAAPLAHMDG